MILATLVRGGNTCHLVPKRQRRPSRFCSRRCRPQRTPFRPSGPRPNGSVATSSAFELAAGGMATVYLARVHGASGFEKLVALKRIHRHLAKEQKYIEMFLDEAKIASRITHPNVCSVFDFGQADGSTTSRWSISSASRCRGCAARWRAISQQRRHPLLPLRMAGIIADACEGTSRRTRAQGRQRRPAQRRSS